MRGLNLGLGLTKTIERFVLPSGFPWSPDFLISGRGIGGYKTTYNPDSDKPTGTIKYISPTGNDTTGDGTLGNPYKTWGKAVTEGAVEIIHHDGYYDRDVKNGAALDFAADVALTAINDGKVFIGRSNSYTGGTWTAQASPNTDVYVTTRSSTLNVLDNTYRSSTTFYVDGTGVLVPYTIVASIAACQAAPGSVFISGSNVYVHTWDSRAPDADVKVCLNEPSLRITSNIKFYAKGINFYGRDPLRFTRTIANTAFLVAEDCTFSNNGFDNGLDINDIDNVRLVNCMAHDNYLDGFNYHIDSVHSTVTKVLEVDCKGFNNGLTNAATTSSNGSTAHEGVPIIRVNGDYNGNRGPNIADGSTEPSSLNLGTRCGNSIAGSANNQDCGFQSADNAQMWLYDCETYGTMAFDRVQTGAGSAIFSTNSFVGVAGQDIGTITTI